MTETAPKVIVIPAKKETPQEQAQKRHLRVAAYCRVSTNSKEQLTSYENQLAYYTEKIMKNPSWTMVKVFADEGKTGTSTCKRKEFLQMIRMCRQGKIDMILAKAVSRFARNTVDTLNYSPAQGTDRRYQQERAHRAEQVQREVHPDKSHVLRPLRDRLSPVRLEQGRSETGCVAVRKPPGLWGKIL